MKPNSGRTVALYFKVSPEEKAAISRNMAQLDIKNQRAYLRKMAVDGRIVHVDMSAIKELIVLLRSVSSNINQIARRANETRNLYAEDVADLRHGYTEIWGAVRALLKAFERL